MEKQENVYGVHAVEAQLQDNPTSVTKLLLAKDRNDRVCERILSVAKQNNVPIERVQKRELDKLLPGCNHQGVAAEVKSLRSYDELELWQLLDGLSKPALLLILDGVQDPHNLGACIRTANAAGVNAVITPKNRAVGLTATVRKVASGAAERTIVIQVTNLARVIRELKARGIWIYGADAVAGASIYSIDMRLATALVLGAEGSGLRSLTAKSCDELFSIPMFGTVSSLNVSVATGISLFEAVRQRNG